MLCNASKEFCNSIQDKSNADGVTEPLAEDEQETQFLVKWARQSHIHNTWETGELVGGPRAVLGAGGWSESCAGCWRVV